MLTAGAGMALLPFAAGASAAQAHTFFRRVGLPIGVQLYCLGPELTRDLDGVLAAVSKIGFKAVEMAGFLGRTPVQLRAAFDKANLSCTSAHIFARSKSEKLTLTGDLGRLADAMHVIGVATVVLPIFPFPERFDFSPRAGETFSDVLIRIGAHMTRDDWMLTADFLNTKGAALQKLGLGIAYHNHNFEFAPLGETFGLEILLRNVDPSLATFEMDAGWVAAAGRNPLTLLKAYPGRFSLMHVKDIKATTQPNYAMRQDPTEVGSGSIDWTELLPAAYTAGVGRFFIEQEPPFVRPRLDSAQISFVALNSIIA